MSGHGPNKDYRELFQALKAQGWDLKRTERGHWRAAPPDSSKAIVHFSESRERFAQHNAIEDLKRSGLVWPPVDAIVDRPGDFDDRWYEAALDPQLPEPPEPPTPVPGDTELAMSEAFDALKDARTLLLVAEATLYDRAKQVAKARAALSQAQTERDEAAAVMSRMRATFNALFEVGT